MDLAGAGDWANTRYGLNLKDRDLRSSPRSTSGEVEFDREDLEEFLVEKAIDAVQAVDLTPAREFLEPDWGRRSLAGWVHHKFGLALDPAEWAGLAKRRGDRASSRPRPAQLYAHKEAEFPVRVGMTRYLARARRQGQPARYDRDGLAAWATERFRHAVDPEELRTHAPARDRGPPARRRPQALPGRRGSPTSSSRRLDAAFGPAPTDGKSSRRPTRRRLAELAAWAREQLGVETTRRRAAAARPRRRPGTS